MTFSKSICTILQSFFKENHLEIYVFKQLVIFGFFNYLTLVMTLRRERRFFLCQDENRKAQQLLNDVSDIRNLPMTPEMIIGLSLSGLLILLFGQSPALKSDKPTKKSVPTIVLPDPDQEILIVQKPKKAHPKRS